MTKVLTTCGHRAVKISLGGIRMLMQIPVQFIPFKGYFLHLLASEKNTALSLCFLSDVTECHS